MDALGPPCPPSIPTPLRLGKGQEPNCPSRVILGATSRDFWCWRGSLLREDSAAGPFHASLSREFAVTPSQAMPGASSLPRPQGLILLFGITKSVTKLTLKSPNLAFGTHTRQSFPNGPVRFTHPSQCFIPRFNPSKNSSI